MNLKEYALDNGYKSRKFLLILLTIILIVGTSIAWAITGWAFNILSALLDTITTLTLGYCGVSAARVAIPTAANALAKKTINTEAIRRKPIEPDEDLAGSKDNI